MRDNRNSPIWVERYRPHRIEDCILPEHIKTTFQEIVNRGVVPNMIFSGKAGGGKTTAAMAICDELEVEWILINASESGNIDTLRNEIREFASTASFGGGRKVVILDEADHLNPQSTQPALRGFIEEFTINVSFIFTCNNLSKIIEPLHSRTSIIEFNVPVSEKNGLMNQFLRRLRMILDGEEVEYDPMVLAALIQRYWPDFRRTINELQRYSLNGKIDEGILAQVRDVPMSELIKHMKNADFTSMRKWVAVHNDSDSVRVMRKIYDSCYEIMDKQSIPGVVLLIGDYQYKAAFVQDQEMHLAAFLTELMQSAEFGK